MTNDGHEAHEDDLRDQLDKLRERVRGGGLSCGECEQLGQKAGRLGRDVLAARHWS